MFIWVILTLLLIFIDQLSKWLAVIFLQGNGTVRVIPYLFNFRYLENDGAAWGMFGSSMGDGAYRWVFLLVSSLAIIALCIYLFLDRPKDKLLLWSLYLILAGGIGNMIDRLLLGFVVDFIEFAFIEFPVFNVADSCVCIGAALLVLYLIITTVKDYKNADNKNVADGGDGGNEA